MVINYVEGTKEAIVFNLNVINLRAANLSKYTNLQAGGNA